MNDEDSTSENKIKLLHHKKECLRYDIDNFKAGINKLQTKQAELLDQKITYQKTKEKILAYFRAKKRPNGVARDFEEAFIKEI